MAKGIREKIKLVSSAGTGHFYTTTKNKRTKPEKMELKKYDPVVRQHVISTLNLLTMKRTQNISRSIEAASENIPRSIVHYVTRVRECRQQRGCVK